MSMNFNRLSTDDKILIMEGAQVLGDVVAGEGTAFSGTTVFAAARCRACASASAATFRTSP